MCRTGPRGGWGETLGGSCHGASDHGPVSFRRVGQSVDLPAKARRWGHDLRGSPHGGCLKSRPTPRPSHNKRARSARHRCAPEGASAPGIAAPRRGEGAERPASLRPQGRVSARPSLRPGGCAAPDHRCAPEGASAPGIAPPPRGRQRPTIATPRRGRQRPTTAAPQRGEGASAPGIATPREGASAPGHRYAPGGCGAPGHRCAPLSADAGHSVSGAGALLPGQRGDSRPVQGAETVRGHEHRAAPRMRSAAVADARPGGAAVAWSMNSARPWLLGRRRSAGGGSTSPAVGGWVVLSIVVNNGSAPTSGEVLLKRCSPMCTDGILAARALGSVVSPIEAGAGQAGAHDPCGVPAVLAVAGRTRVVRLPPVLASTEDTRSGQTDVRLRLSGRGLWSMPQQIPRMEKGRRRVALKQPGTPPALLPTALPTKRRGTTTRIQADPSTPARTSLRGKDEHHDPARPSGHQRSRHR